MYSPSATVNSTNAATQNIHFQASLSWHGPSGDTGSITPDMDLHLIEPGGAYDGGTDCYYANCRLPNGNTTVGAFLNVDCISQCNGPENIWIPDSNPLLVGNYHVCVDPYSGEGTSLSVDIFNSAGALIDTVTRLLLNGGTGVWNVGSFNCGVGGTCTWSRVDALNTAPCL